ncbi:MULTISPECIES: hypothetical protein [unclassified Streptomyces]|uniref:hypothetical protein n=1 Tax=unclassified Streptomyces TaxID=2593676 RepID=UPI0013A69F4B|nr:MULTISPECIES: hypothetical protein [unclassified Streptomyces]
MRTARGFTARWTGAWAVALARAAGAVRPEITITQVLKLVGAIAPATEQDTDGLAPTAWPRPTP